MVVHPAARRIHSRCRGRQVEASEGPPVCRGHPAADGEAPRGRRLTTRRRDRWRCTPRRRLRRCRHRLRGSLHRWRGRSAGCRARPRRPPARRSWSRAAGDRRVRRVPSARPSRGAAPLEAGGSPVGDGAVHIHDDRDVPGCSSRPGRHPPPDLVSFCPRMNRGAQGDVLRGALAALRGWAAGGEPAAASPRLVRDGNAIARDERGIARGGLRTRRWMSRSRCIAATGRAPCSGRPSPSTRPR